MPAAVTLSFLVLLSVPLLAIFIVIFFMFALPYWMGERRPRNFALAGLVMLLITGVALSMFLTYDSYRPFVPEQASDDGTLSGGTVDPVFGDADTIFTYRVVFKGADEPKEGPRVNITSTFSLGTYMNETMVLENPEEANYQEGVVYVLSTKLPSDNHFFYFSVLRANDTWVVSSDASTAALNSRGPVNMSAAAFFGAVVASFVPFVYITIGVPLFLVILLYWFIGKRSRQRRAAAATRVCPSCGGEWPPGEEACPACGFKG